MKNDLFQEKRSLSQLKKMGNKCPVNVLIFDIETCLTWMVGFSLGKQVMNHKQLLNGYFSTPRIISIHYKWLHEDKVHTLHWGKSEDDERKMIEEFDSILNKADITIGKNNYKFDNRKINALRYCLKCPPNPGWGFSSLDLEGQLRNQFMFFSHKLDYLSERISHGGKNKMGFNDWVKLFSYRLVNIIKSLGVADNKTLDLMTRTIFGMPLKEINKDGVNSSKKMFDYGEKDVLDTEAIILDTEPYIDVRRHIGRLRNTGGCTGCGEGGDFMAAAPYVNNKGFLKTTYKYKKQYPFVMVGPYNIFNKEHRRLKCKSCGYTGNYCQLLSHNRLGIIKGPRNI